MDEGLAFPDSTNTPVIHGFGGIIGSRVQNSVRVPNPRILIDYFDTDNLFTNSSLYLFFLKT